MKIIVTYYCDNGYTCGCCGKSWTDTETYDVPDGIDLIVWKDQHADYIKKLYGDRNDYGRRFINSVNIIDTNGTTDKLKNLLQALNDYSSSLISEGYYSIGRDLKEIVSRYDDEHEDDDEYAE
jgi:hypothetical protein